MPRRGELAHVGDVIPTLAESDSEWHFRIGLDLIQGGERLGVRHADWITDGF